MVSITDIINPVSSSVVDQLLVNVNYTENYDSDKIIYSKTDLITPLTYEAPKLGRYLWTDMFSDSITIKLLLHFLVYRYHRLLLPKHFMMNQV